MANAENQLENANENNVVTRVFEGNEVRAVIGNGGEPWFVAADVCKALGHSNPSKAVSDHVDEDDVTKRYTIDCMGRKQMVNHVNESGLYALIFGSTKDEAKRFKKWVTSEVLPSIRQTGRYEILSAAPAENAIVVPKTLAQALRLAADQAEQIEAQAAQLEKQKPAVDFVRQYVASGGAMGVRETAKALRAGQKEFVDWLIERKIVYRLAGNITPCARHDVDGRFHVKVGTSNEHGYSQTKFTTLGFAWISKLWADHIEKRGTPSLPAPKNPPASPW